MICDRTENIGFLCWENNASEICDRIASSATRAKLILKTRNEADLLKGWLAHHCPIFGKDGIVIFDNVSDRLETLETYASYSDRIQIFQFAGMHNHIHNPNLFGALYEALRKSAQYYIFLDTDERLYWCDDGFRLITDQTLLDRVAASGEAVIPGIWSANVPLSDTRYCLTFRNNQLLSGLRGGKPFISTELEITGFGNHNAQLPKKLFLHCCTARLLVFHLKNLSPMQRILANVQKLQSYNCETGALEQFGLHNRYFNANDLLAVDPSILPSGNARNYIEEVQRLTGQTGGHPERRIALSDVVEISSGHLRFLDPSNEQQVRSFLAEPRPVFKDAFNLAA